MQPLLASDVVRFVGEPVAAVVTEEMYQGEDAIELVDVDYDLLPAVVDMHDALSGERGLLFPDAGTNVVCTFGDAAASNPDLFDGLRGRGSARSSRTSGSPRPRWRAASAAAAWGEDGRLTAWIPNQGAQGTKGAIMGMLGLEAGGRADHHARCRRRVRREVRRGRRARGHLLDRAAARPPGALVGDAHGEPAGDAARPGAGAEDHDRRHEGRHRPRLPDRDHSRTAARTRRPARSCRR